MMEIIIRNRKETSVSDEALYALYKESYKKWTEQGLDAPWMHCTLEDFCQYLQKATVFVALNQVNGELLGMHFFNGYKKRGMAFGYFLAVSPEAQGEGVASRMLAHEEEVIRQAGYRYLRGVTATTAEWSVRWHLRNGYRIIGYYHSPDDNFANYVFRKQLVPSLLWDSAVYCRLRYILAYTITHLLKDSHGHDNLLGRITRKIIHKGHKGHKKSLIVW